MLLLLSSSAGLLLGSGSGSLLAPPGSLRQLRLVLATSLLLCPTVCLLLFLGLAVRFYNAVPL
jgi:hypothetical protein